MLNQVAAKPTERDIERLASLLAVYAPRDGRFGLRAPGVHAIRTSSTNAEPLHALQQAGLCVVAQGAKNITVGSDVFHYDASRMLVYSVDVPVAAHITEASRSKPFLCFRLDLDAQRIADLTFKVYPNGVPAAKDVKAVFTGHADASIVDAVIRLLELAAQPEEAELLAPLVVDEILIRLLRSPLGGRVAQIGQSDSRTQRVAKAIAWIREHFDASMEIESLASLVHMSTSTFHQHFKSVTGMSPLQYQKVLRLQEARRLMLSAMLDAGTAGGRVGYVSASQFSREYSRYFGKSPSRDIADLRASFFPNPVEQTPTGTS